MQIVTFARAVSQVSVLKTPDGMTEYWMNMGVVYNVAVLISIALSMSADEMFDKSDAEIRALLSTNKTFAQSDWMIDWIMASRCYERVPLPEKALVGGWDWICHDMCDGRLTMYKGGDWYCHETKTHDDAPCSSYARVSSRPTVNVYLV